MNEELPIRPDLIDESPYGAPQLDVSVKLNTNENPFSHDQEFVTSAKMDLENVLQSVNRYPDRDAIELRKKLASYIGTSVNYAITPEQVWPANGSNEILLQLFQLFGGPNRIAIGFEPSYSMHPIISKLTHTNWHSIPRDQNFNIDSNWDEDLLSQANLILVCSPNNPTGTTTDIETIKKLHDSTRAIIVVDEAYAEFSNLPSAVSLINTHSRIVVVRTMSKAFGFAGVRLGYAVSQSKLIDAIQLVRLPYHLSSITQQIASTALSQSSRLKKNVEILIDQREMLKSKLEEMGLRVMPSDANFLLFGEFESQESVWKFLVDNGVLVRDVGIQGWLRVTCGSESENIAFLTHLNKWLELAKG